MIFIHPICCERKHSVSHSSGMTASRMTFNNISVGCDTVNLCLDTMKRMYTDTIIMYHNT